MQSWIVILSMAMIVFSGVYLIGNPVDILINPEASQQEIEDVIRSLGLDRPLWEQFFHFIANALQGDLGN